MLVKQDVRVVWDRVVKGLQEIKRMRPGPMWRPEDLYFECRSGGAYVYMDPDGDPEDFVILQPRKNPYTCESELIIWVAYSGDSKASEKYLGDVIDIARYMNATRLIMQTPRRGFQRSKLWSPYMTEYHMEVGNE